MGTYSTWTAAERDAALADLRAAGLVARPITHFDSRGILVTLANAGTRAVWGPADLAGILAPPAPAPVAAMTAAAALQVIADLRAFTREEYAGALAHVGDGRYVVVYGIRRELDRTNCFTSPAEFVEWREACVEQGTYAPTL